MRGWQSGNLRFPQTFWALKSVVRKGAQWCEFLAEHQSDFEFPGFLLDRITVKHYILPPPNIYLISFTEGKKNIFPTKVQENTHYLSQ